MIQLSLFPPELRANSIITTKSKRLRMLVLGAGNNGLRSNIALSQLRPILTAVQYGSFRRAAEALVLRRC